MSDEQMDDETLAMLDELEGQKTEREKLEARADELGVKYRGNTGDDTIRERIAEAEAALVAEPDPAPASVADASAAPAPVVEELTITNKKHNRLVIGGISLAHDEPHTLTAEELADDRIMRKVRRAIEIGILVEG